MPDTPEPYAGIAEFYEAEHEGLESDIAFFDRRAVGGAVLIGGCGTGRVSRALSTNHSVTGLDLSADMLAVARRRDPGGTYILGDLRTFDLGRRFNEVILPNGAFNFLTTRVDQLECLRRCAAALRPGGILTLDMPMPVFRLWGSPHDGPSEAWTGRVGGRTAVRTRETRRAVVHQRLSLTDRYYLDGELVATRELALRIVLPSEAQWMVEAVGLWGDEVCGNYSGAPIDDDSERIIVRAVAG